jgi:hypothetical protein
LTLLVASTKDLSFEKIQAHFLDHVLTSSSLALHVLRYQNRAGTSKADSTPTESVILGTVKTLLGLSYDRAYKRFYPAIDPLISRSRYLDQLAPWLSKHLDPNWTRDVKRLHELLEQGDSINQMMQVTGEEGIALDDYCTWQKSVLVDMAYLQQDAFDEVDACMPRVRFARDGVACVPLGGYAFFSVIRAARVWRSWPRRAPSSNSGRR